MTPSCKWPILPFKRLITGIYICQVYILIVCYCCFFKFSKLSWGVGSIVPCEQSFISCMVFIVYKVVCIAGQSHCANKQR